MVSSSSGIEADDDRLPLPNEGRHSDNASPDCKLLLQRCADVLAEVTAFQDFLRENGKSKDVEVRKFRVWILGELNNLQNLSKSQAETAKSIHTLKSSNLPFYDAVWTAAKGCEGVLALGKRHRTQKQDARTLHRVRNESVLVDIVARDGEEWVKVSTVTERRLLFEIAEAGWIQDFQAPGSMKDAIGEDRYPGGLAEDSASRTLETSDNGGDSDDSDSSGDIGLVKAVEELQAAATINCVRWKVPHLRLILTRIRDGVSPDVDRLLARIRSTGATVQCNSDAPMHEVLTDAFQRMLPSAHAGISQSINFDCTILLALISDISHTSLNPLPSLHSSVCQQISSESSDNLLPGTIYPVVEGRSLFCASEAAHRMWEILNSLGTASEKERANILFGQGAFSHFAPQELQAELGKRSVHPVPSDLRLPINIVAEGVDSSRPPLPTVARKLEKNMSKVNQSVFFLGWQNGWTTMTSNRAAVRTIENILDDCPTHEWVGPNFWICRTARSLLGKEKARVSKIVPSTENTW